MTYWKAIFWGALLVALALLGCLAFGSLVGCGSPDVDDYGDGDADGDVDGDVDTAPELGDHTVAAELQIPERLCYWGADISTQDPFVELHTLESHPSRATGADELTATLTGTDPVTGFDVVVYIASVDGETVAHLVLGDCESASSDVMADSDGDAWTFDIVFEGCGGVIIKDGWIVPS